jgi:glutathione peroxidase
LYTSNAGLNTKKMKKSSNSYIILLFAAVLIINSCKGSSQSDVVKSKSIYDISLKGINGEDINLNNFKGKKILFVNVASKCGFTPQYEKLQKLHEKYGDKIVVIGLPCNQFADQEPGTHEEILQFCRLNYGVTFQLTEKINVKGPDQHPLYSWLTRKELNGVKDSEVKWNFQKYLVDEEGNFIDVFYSVTSPLSNKITSLLN